MTPAGRSPAQPLASPVLLGSVALLLVVVCHLPLRHGGYVLDDHVVVESNPIVERGSPAEIFTSYWAEGGGGGDRALYRPLPIFSFALERRLGGAGAAPGRGVNVALHVLATWLLIAFCRRLRATPLTTAAAALLFALHPVHVEAIAGLVGRAELLAALFTLLALWLLSYAGRWPGERRAPSPGVSRAAAWGAGLALFLALCSKEIALAALPLMLALEALFRPPAAATEPAATRRWWIDRAASLAPAALALVLYLVLRVEALDGLAPAQLVLPSENPLVALDGVQRVATALGLVARYAGLLLYPIRLSADYSGAVIAPEHGLLAPRPLAGLLIVCAALTLVARPLALRARGAPLSTQTAQRAFGVLLLGLPYLVVGNLLFPVGAAMAERFLYLPSTGFCLLVGLLLQGLAGGSGRPAVQLATRGLTAALLILVVAYGTRTWSRCLDWHDDASLMLAAVQARPQSARAHYVVGVTARAAGAEERARVHLQRAGELDPSFGAPWLQLGQLHGAAGRLDEAESAFREALRRAPGLAAAHFGLALVHRRRQRPAEAERELRKAILRDPRLAGAWAELGNLLSDQQRWSEAIAAYRRATALGRTDLEPRIRQAERRRARAEPSVRPPD